MTSFVNDENEYLEYSGPDPSLSKQAVSIFEFKIKGTFSVNFSLVKNSHNCGVLGYYGPMQVGSTAFRKNRFTMIRNGNRLERGFIVIQEDRDGMLECFFLAGNGSWFNALNAEMKGLDYEQYSLLWDESSYDTQTTATEGIVFPIVDWGYNGRKLGHNIDIEFQSSPTVNIGISDDIKSEAYPCFFFHSALTILANQTGVNITGNLLTDARFLGMIMTPEGPNLSWPPSLTEPVRAFVKRSADQTYLIASGVQQLQFDEVLDQGDSNAYDATNFQYYARKTATYRITLDLRFSVSQAYTVTGFINGTTSFPITGGSTPALSRLSKEQFINLNKGDYVYIRNLPASSNYNLLATSTLKFEICEDIQPYQTTIDVSGPAANAFTINASAIMPSIKGIDFIKFLCNYFNCISTFDEATQTLSIDKLQSITDQEDWSEYYQSHSSSYARGLGTNNYINLAPSEEEDIVRYNVSNKVRYGGGNIPTDYETNDDKTLYDAPFGGAYDKANRTKLGWNMPYIKFFELEDDEGYSFTGVTDSSGEAALTHASLTKFSKQIVRVKSATGTYDGYAILSTGGSPTSAILGGVDFVIDDTGTFYFQKISSISGPSRILFTIPNYDQQGAGGPASYTVFLGAGSSSESTSQTAFFCKPIYNQDIDDFKISLSITDPIGREFNNSIDELYYSKVKNGFNSPLIKARLLLPEAVYANFNFDKFVYLKTKDLTGLFFVNRIDPYVDSKTECGVELIFM